LNVNRRFGGTYRLYIQGRKNISWARNQRESRWQAGHLFLGGVRLSPLGTSATVGLLYQPRMIDDDDYGAVGGMRIDKGNRSTRRKPAPVPLCPPQIPHDLTWDRTRAAAVGSQRLTAWTMARPLSRPPAFMLVSTRRYIPEDGNIHNHRCENLKFYTNLDFTNTSGLH
jgi:hypothetical protein